MIRQTVVSATALGALLATMIVAPAASAAPTSAEYLAPAPDDSRIVVVDDRVADADEVADIVADAVGTDRSNTDLLDEVGAIVAPLDDAAAASISSLPGVEVINDEVVTIGATSTQSEAPWNLSRLDQQFLPVDTAYSYPSTGGSGVRVYVIDSGVTPNAQQFGARLLSGATAVDDGRGTSDCNGHGTHVAGSVASTTWGVAKKASIVPVRVFDCSNAARLSTVLTAIDWVIAQHPAGTPGVINMSLSGGQNIALDGAVAEAAAAGLIVVAAAGNNGADACRESPGAAPESLTVGATTIQDARASFSNFGSCLDIFAPGNNIVSVDNDGSNSPVLMSGTSMAAPHVAGAAALLWSEGISRTARQVEDLLRTTALSGVLSNVGAGSPNRLLSSIAVNSALLPGTVSALTARANGSSGADVEWDAPTVVGSGVVDYTVQFRRGGTSTWLTATDGVSTATAAQITGMQAGTSYDIRVRAESRDGSGPYSSPTTVTTVPLGGISGTVRNLTVMQNEPQRLRLVWLAPENVMATDYEIQYTFPGAGRWLPTFETVSASPEFTLNNPSTGYDFTFRVRAVAAGGVTEWSSVAVSTRPNVPSAPAALTVTENSFERLTLTWPSVTAPETTTLSGYELAYSFPGASGWTPIAIAPGTTSFTFLSPSPGFAFTFRIRAINGWGMSTGTYATLNTPSPLATAPRDFRATENTLERLSFSWTAPESVGAAALSRYELAYTYPGLSGWITVPLASPLATSHTFFGPSQGFSFTFRVRAVSAWGAPVRQDGVRHQHC